MKQAASLPQAKACEQSVEHVLNVLARLTAVPAPESAATVLQVSTPPLANTERYDSLRADSVAPAAAEEPDHA